MNSSCLGFIKSNSTAMPLARLVGKRVIQVSIRKLSAVSARRPSEVGIGSHELSAAVAAVSERLAQRSASSSYRSPELHGRNNSHRPVS